MKFGKIFSVVVLVAVASYFAFQLGWFDSLIGKGELMIADFDTGDKPNNLGGDFGTWDKDPADETQKVEMLFEKEDAAGKDGYCVKLVYDVRSPRPAYNGMWMKLGGIDAKDYKTLNIFIRGDKKNDFTDRLKVELKDRTGKPSRYIIRDITGEWKKFSIPLEKFRHVNDWSDLREFVVVFDDLNSRPKEGAVYIDNISFSKA